MHRLFLIEIISLETTEAGLMHSLIFWLAGRKILLVSSWSPLSQFASEFVTLVIYTTVYNPMHLTLSSDNLDSTPGLLWDSGKIAHLLWALLFLSIKWRERSKFISRAFSSHIWWSRWVRSQLQWASPLLHSLWDEGLRIGRHQCMNSYFYIIKKVFTNA